MARKFQDANLWGEAYEQELAMQNKFGTYKSIPRSYLPPNTIVVSRSVSFIYKTDGSGHILTEKYASATAATKL